MSLTDLFSAESPSPPRRPPQEQESLFFSPGATPVGASQRSARSASPLSPSRSRIRRRTSASAGPSRARSEERYLDPLVNRHGAGTLHANINGRAVDIEDDAFAVQDPLGPGPLTHGAYESLPHDPLGALGGLDDGEAGEDGEPAKKKRRMAKVDYDRLLAAPGLPRLMKIAKSWKVRGKGKEREDLACLVDMYTVWAHGMFPKGDFSYTIKRVEAVCRTNRMMNAIAGMKETFYGKNEDGYDVPGDDLGDLPDPDEFDESLPSDIAARQASVVRQQPEISGIVSQPLFDEGGPDEDELAALQDAERSAPARSLMPVYMGDMPLDIGEEDEW